MKEHLLTLTRQQVADLIDLQKSLRSAPTDRIRQRAMLDAGATTARSWFDSVRPALEKASLPAAPIDAFSQRFEGLLRATTGRPMRAGYLGTVTETLNAYKIEIIHQLEIGSFATPGRLSIAP